MPKYNPFQPNSIVSPGMFSGRVAELESIEQILFQTKNGNPQHFLLHGERGIGKSSLLVYTETVARGDRAPMNGECFRFLTVSVDLDNSVEENDIPRKIGVELKRTLNTHQRLKSTAKTAWEFLSGWEVLGVRYHGKSVAASDLLDDLTFVMEQTTKAVSKDFDGILMLIDEGDKAPVAANLGSFSKLFTERLVKRGVSNVALGVAGVSSIIANMQRSHESSLRVFEILQLEPLLPHERIEVINLGLAAANRRNKEKTIINDNAATTIADLSEGYPHFIQQYAYCAFDHDRDNIIDYDDVIQGAEGENGALRQLGAKYFDHQFFSQIRSPRYRLVLTEMAQHLDGWVSKQQLREATKLKETILSNALSTLKARNLIVANSNESGVYKLPHKSFAVWLRQVSSFKTTFDLLAGEDDISDDEGTSRSS